jgi:hypothetical protein
VLDHPELPLTNNAAERALRHWVIARRLSYGTRNAPPLCSSRTWLFRQQVRGGLAF